MTETPATYWAAIRDIATLRARLEKLESQNVIRAQERADAAARIEALERALGRASQTIRNIAIGFSSGDAKTILLNESVNADAALAAGGGK